MKRNALTLVVGILLLLIFFLLLFTFQVRQTEVAVVTTFAKPSADPIEKPGLYFKWPAPIQRVYTFDKRIHNFEDEFDQTLTRDGYNLLASVYVGWTIQNPREFFNSFPTGTPEAAEPQLQSLVRTTKKAVLGRHDFTDFVNRDPKMVKFTEVEQEILNTIRQNVLATKYGVAVEFVGIKRLGLPESVTQKVFDRMTAERQREVDHLKALGEGDSYRIKSTADRDKSEILAKAENEAKKIRGEAEARAQQSFSVFNQNPEFAKFLLQVQALEKALGKSATLVVDPRTAPFNLLLQSTIVQPSPEPEKTARPTGPALSSDGGEGKVSK
ncbi:MAG TPA: protease modulator HflC [Verrucomicrobiae bacterium]|nr:protease modulator HflC [Verrucomicrobiae bacterium]